MFLVVCIWLLGGLGQFPAIGQEKKPTPKDETADVGIDLGMPVVEAIGSEAKSKFTGKIPKVTIEVKEMKKTDKAVEDKARMEAAHKKAMLD